MHPPHRAATKFTTALIALTAILLSPFSSAWAAAPVISGTPAHRCQGGRVLLLPTERQRRRSEQTRCVSASRTNQSGRPSRPKSGVLRGQPKSSQVGKYPNVRITVTDGRSSASLAAYTITVTSTSSSTSNRAPTISGAPATSVAAAQSYTFQPSASDPDGDALSFSIQNKPSWASFSSTTGRLTGTPTTSQAGSYGNIVIGVSDGRLSASLAAFSITVTTTSNAAPVISGSPATSVAAGQPYNFQPSATDADGDVLTFSIQNRPAWATFSPTTGRLSGTPTSSQAGTYSNIVISVSDGKVSRSLSAFSITRHVDREHGIGDALVAGTDAEHRRLDAQRPGGIPRALRHRARQLHGRPCSCRARA